tara:strand:+ start:5289 stop:5492 length:204 start_codon:yes stop_codon:yes gene_type:complete
MSDKKIQGEGDYAAARRFNKRSEEFAKSESGKTAAQAGDHSEKFSKEELEKAEEEAAGHARDGDTKS